MDINTGESYREKMLGRINPDHRFLHFLVRKGIIFSEERDPNSHTSLELMNMIDSQFTRPSQLHHILMEQLFMDIHKYRMGQERARLYPDRHIPLTDEEVSKDFSKQNEYGFSHRDLFEAFYEYCDILHYLNDETVPERDRNWANAHNRANFEAYERVFLVAEQAA